MRWLLERALPWHSDSCDDGGIWGARGRLALNPAGRYGAILLWYRAGVHAVEEVFEEHTEPWLMIAICYRDRLPMLLEASCATEEGLGRGSRRGSDGWGVLCIQRARAGATQQGRSSRATLWDRGGDARGCVYERLSTQSTALRRAAGRKREEEWSRSRRERFLVVVARKRDAGMGRLEARGVLGVVVCRSWKVLEMRAHAVPRNWLRFVLAWEGAVRAPALTTSVLAAGNVDWPLGTW